MISKTERTELRAVVRQQYKVLRAEIKQREAELRAEAHSELEAEAGHKDEQWERVVFLANEAVKEANRKVNDALREHNMAHSDPKLEYSLVTLTYQFNSLKKSTDQSQAKTRIDLDVKERVRRAELTVERQEADLLRTLATDALESEEARAFLKTIPTVSELVPAARLQELLQGGE